MTTQGQWPQVTAHDQVGAQLARLIPAGASVSAQSMLTPHVSERTQAFQFPSAEERAEYIFWM